MRRTIFSARPLYLETQTLAIHVRDSVQYSSGMSLIVPSGIVIFILCGFVVSCVSITS